MGEEENKATVRMFYDEVLNRRNLGVIDKVTAENYVDHTAAPGLPPGREGEKLWFQMLHAAFPELTLRMIMLGLPNVLFGDSSSMSLANCPTPANSTTSESPRLSP